MSAKRRSRAAIAEANRPAVGITYRQVDELIPAARNARTHSEGQVAELAGAIKEFGWTNPVLVDEESGILAGHGRVLAARLLGLEQVPCIELGHLSAGQKRALMIADNKLALNAGWDDELLASELAGLKDEGFDLGLVGFGAEELEALLASVAAEPSSGPATPAEPRRCPHCGGLLDQAPLEA